MRLYLIRHAATAASPGLCYGRLDLPADPAASRAAAANVRALLPQESGTLAAFCSPARRCVALADELGVSARMRMAPELREMDFGRWEGVPWSDVPRAELDDWSRDLWGYRPGGGESVSMVRERWDRWRAAAIAEGHREALVITHAGLIRVALVHAGLVPAERVADAAIPFGSVHPIDIPERSRKSPQA